MIDSTFCERPAASANTTIKARPISSVFLAPMRLEIQLLKNMAIPVIRLASGEQRKAAA